jgi:hypothetical protein
MAALGRGLRGLANSARSSAMVGAGAAAAVLLLGLPLPALLASGCAMAPPHVNTIQQGQDGGEAEARQARGPTHGRIIEAAIS